ncbi:MAG: lipopolysaccharide transport system permease protein [Arenicella sp.]|jgi:lipopolysaccharide transport system permease protein
MNNTPAEEWTQEITAQRGLLSLPLKEIWRYRDLLLLFVKRDFVAFYKQTVLGPLWFIIQPVLTTLMFTLVFGNIAGLSTDGLPDILFYLAGVTVWGYFSECLTKTSTTFSDNAHLFGKIYFPRMISPLAVIASNLMKFGIQFCIFLAVVLFYWMKGAIQPNSSVLLLPYLILLMAAISLGIGLIFSSMTAKYRDLRFLLSFGVQLLMYATPVIYPMSAIPAKYAAYIQLNPITPIIEMFRYSFLGVGDASSAGILYASIFAALVLSLGMIIFNRVEVNFMDSV